ncbi:UNVERIFIED_CONTAM: hypothetical protein RMT77_000268 [Armadillidium vulgare]
MIQDNAENEFDTLYFISAIFKTSAADIFRKFNHFNYKKLREEQMKDDFLKSILQNPEESSLEVSTRKVVHENEEIELAMDVSKPQYPRLIVPQSMITEFIQHFHALGHLGIKKTLSKLKKIAVWPSMRKTIRDFILRCYPCLRTKMYKNISPPYEDFEPVGHKFEVVHLDILKLPEVKGDKYLLTLIDRYSRYPYAYPLKNIEAKTITDTMVKEFLPIGGVMNTYIMDRGAQFSSEIFKSVCENLGSNHRFTTAQCPQSNGLIENFHKTLLSTFRTMLTEICNTSWLELLPFSLICLRTAPFDDCGLSPTLLMYGQNIRIPGALIEPPNIPWPLEHQTYAEKLQTLFAMPLSPKFKSRNSKVYVSKALDECKYILIKDAQYGKSKLAPAYHGPYSVVRTLGNNIYFWNRKRIDCVNKINVKPYFKIEELGDNNNNNCDIRY